MVSRQTGRGAADVALIGPWPPPWGGISVHLHRLTGRLNAAGISWRRYDPHRLDALPFRVHEPLVHIHTPHQPWARAAIGGPTVIQSFHNSRVLVPPDALGPARRLVLGRLLRSAAAVHVVTSDLGEIAVAWGVPHERVHVYPAFLPPDPDEAAAFPPDLAAFLEAREPALVVIGDPRRTHHGQPTYGLDDAVHLVKRLVPSHPNVGMLVFLHIGARLDHAATRALHDRIRKAGVEERIRLVQLDGPCWPAFRHADLYVRPTATDGDAVAVREALHVGTAVVASDAAPRPEGVTVYPYGDADALVEAATRTLALAPAPWSEDPTERILEMYRKFL